MSNKVRIGQINYANVWPVFYDFPTSDLSDQVEIVPMTPTACNQALENEQIDMGFISSFAYLKHSERYLLFPDLSISARGKVSSILLFHHQPLHEIASGKIALANTSATSTHLLRMILERYLSGTPQYVTTHPDLSVMFNKHHADGALLIGDDAIRAAFQQPTPYITDLGDFWYRQTGQTVTYAVWAVNRSFVDKHSNMIVELYQALMRSKLLGIQNIPLLVQRACSIYGGERLFWQQYYQHLSYELSDDEQQGLAFYHNCLTELGIHINPFTMQLWNPHTTCDSSPAK
jgi:chorismate dehydratase